MAYGSLPGLRIGTKPGIELERQRSAEDEAARFGGGDHADPLACEMVVELGDRLAECRGMAQERRDVLEQDAGLGEIGDIADVVAEIERRGAAAGHESRTPEVAEARNRLAPGRRSRRAWAKLAVVFESPLSGKIRAKSRVRAGPETVRRHRPIANTAGPEGGSFVSREFRLARGALQFGAAGALARCVRGTWSRPSPTVGRL